MVLVEIAVCCGGSVGVVDGDGLGQQQQYLLKVSQMFV
jgi:hypothetical protein